MTRQGGGGGIHVVHGKLTFRGNPDAKTALKMHALRVIIRYNPVTVYACTETK